MENSNNILIALSKLQDNLKDIESAKAQVEAIVNSYGETNSSIVEYVDQLAKVHVDINNIIDSYNSVYDGFEERIQKAIGVLSTTCESIAEKDANTASKVINEAKNVCENINKQFEINSNKNTEQFNNTTNVLIGDTKEKIEAGVAEINNAIASLQKLTAKASEVHNKISIALEPINELKEKIEAVNSNLQKAHREQSKQLSSINDNINQTSEAQLANSEVQIKLLNDIFEQQKEAHKKQSELIQISENNKLFSIFGLILLGAIIVLLFVK